MADESKQLPNVILQDIETDAATGMKIRERYVCITANEPMDKLVSKAKETLREMKQ